MAFGAALSGVRALAAMKHVGLNVAADSLMSLSYIGAHAGLVLVVCDDPGLHSSQNEQDTRLFARFAGVPVLEPSDAQEAHDFTKLAFEISEAFDTPVIVRSTTRLSHTRSAVRVGPRRSVAAKGFIDAPSKTVTIPANARRLHPKLIEREAKIGRYLETSPLTRWEKGDRRFGVVTGSTAYLYVKEVAPDASILKLGAAYPLPEGRHSRFRRLRRPPAGGRGAGARAGKRNPRDGTRGRRQEILSARRRTVARTGARRASRPRASSRPRRRRSRSTSSRWRARRCCVRAARTPRPIWRCAASRRGSPATSAATRSRPSSRCARSTPPYAWARASPTPIGMAAAGEKKPVVATIGDSTFLHSGIPPLIDAVYNKANITVVILDNSITAMTGGQDHPGTGRTLRGEPTHKVDYEAICRAVGVDWVRRVDPYEVGHMYQTLREAIVHKGVSVVISERPCVLDPVKIKGAPLAVALAGCVACQSCMNLGCPSIVWADETLRRAPQGEDRSGNLHRLHVVRAGLPLRLHSAGGPMSAKSADPAGARTRGPRRAGPPPPRATS